MTIIPSSPTHTSETLIDKSLTSGKASIAKASLLLSGLAGEQPFPSVTLVIVTD